MDGRLTVQVSESAAQEQEANYRAGDETETVGGTEQHDDGLIFRSQTRSEERQNHLDGGNAEDDESRGPGLFTGVENTQVQKHDGIWNKRERREGQRPAKNLRGFAGELQIREKTDGDGAAECGEECDDRHQRNHGQARTDGQIADHCPIVAIGCIAGQSRHDGGQQGNSDDAVGHLQQQPSLLVNRRRCLGGSRGNIGGDEVTSLGNCHVGNNRDTHAGELFDAVVDTPQRTQINARALEVGNHDGCLNDDTQGGTKTQKQDVRIGG